MARFQTGSTSHRHSNRSAYKPCCSRGPGKPKRSDWRNSDRSKPQARPRSFALQKVREWEFCPIPPEPPIARCIASIAWAILLPAIALPGQPAFHGTARRAQPPIGKVACLRRSPAEYGRRWANNIGGTRRRRIFRRGGEDTIRTERAEVG